MAEHERQSAPDPNLPQHAAEPVDAKDVSGASCSIHSIGRLLAGLQGDSYGAKPLWAVCCFLGHALLLITTPFPSSPVPSLSWSHHELLCYAAEICKTQMEADRQALSTGGHLPARNAIYRGLPASVGPAAISFLDMPLLNIVTESTRRFSRGFSRGVESCSGKSMTLLLYCNGMLRR